MVNGTKKLPEGRKKHEIRKKEEEGIITVDTDLCVIIINALARDMLGVTRCRMIGRRVMDVLPVADPSVKSRLAAALQQVMSSGSSGSTIEHVRLVPKSGAGYSISLDIAPIAGDSGHVSGAVLTLRRKTLRRGPFSEVAGREGSDALLSLMGRIAHDVNNSLSSVLANIQLARLGMDEQSDGDQRLDSAEESVLRARELSGQLLALSSGKVAKLPVGGAAGRKKRHAPWPRKEKRPARIAAGKGRAVSDKILLMDDDEAILSATSEMLKFLGYDVTVAENGDTVVELYGKAQDAGLPFDAVVLDVTVPGGMGALETLPRLRNLDPHIRAIVSSGYSTNPVIVNFASYGFAAVIVKPYGFKELGVALETAFRN